MAHQRKSDLVRIRKQVAAQQRQKAFADQHRSEIEFEVGDRVWLDLSRLRSEVAQKLGKKREGPFDIVAKV